MSSSSLRILSCHSARIFPPAKKQKKVSPPSFSFLMCFSGSIFSPDRYSRLPRPSPFSNQIFDQHIIYKNSS